MHSKVKVEMSLNYVLKKTIPADILMPNIEGKYKKGDTRTTYHFACGHGVGDSRLIYIYFNTYLHVADNRVLWVIGAR